jgi:transcriptional regulator with XRE-family HTH domain
MGQRGVSGTALAAQIGKSQNYVATRLRNEKPFTVDDVEAIAAALQVPLQDLVQDVAAVEAPARRS